MIALLLVLFAAGSPRFDLVLAGGRVIDGTGAPWVRADVGIRDDRVAALGDLSRARAKRRIDVHGLAVAPGFIDLLGQSELSALVDPRAESKIRQGITSELTGEGISPAPMNDAWVHEKADWLRKYELKIDWTDLRGYFRRLRRARPAINIGVMVGAAQVRGVVLGFGDAQPDAKQLTEMQRLVEEAMEQGALGLSTALIYQPGSFARTDELIALAQTAARYGGFYATHLRSEGAKIFEALDEAFAIARAAHIPVEIWHLKVGRSHWGHMQEVAARIERARSDGIDVTADAYPYVASANPLSASLPDWVNAGGVDDMVARLRDPKLQQAADSVLAKVTAILPEMLRPHLAEPPFYVSEGSARPPTGVDLAEVRGAIHEARKMSIDYSDDKGARTHRTIWPIAMAYYVDVSLIGAWCELRQDFRSFRVDRILGSRLLDEHFSPEHGRLAAAWLALSKEAPI